MARNLSLLILLCVSFFSCEYSEKDAKEFLSGIYSYKIPLGEVHILKINTDFTFEQIVYSKSKNEILYKNKGKMVVSFNQIEFKNWLECYELSEQKLLLKPYITYSMNHYWKKSKERDIVTIIMFDQTNYIFRKI